MIDQGLTVSMTEFIVLHVLDSARQGPRLRAAQRARQWLDLDPVTPGAITVAVLGLGALGVDAATRLAALGFSVRGWSRSRKEIAGIESFAGGDGFRRACPVRNPGLPAAADGRHPRHPQRHGLRAAGARRKSRSRGARRASGRSRSVSALQSGQLSRAILDVFATEPLPSDHPFWRHPQVTVTPACRRHYAPGTGAADIVENYRRAMAGEPLINQVDRAKGY